MVKLLRQCTLYEVVCNCLSRNIRWGLTKIAKSKVCIHYVALFATKFSDI